MLFVNGRGYIMNEIFDFFAKIWDWTISLFSACLDWFLDILASLITSLLSGLASALPDLSEGWNALSVVYPYVNFVDNFVAVKYGFALLTAYFAFIIPMITVKLIIKLFIPCVG